MKILVAYDGSACADAAIDDMQRAGLPGDAEAQVLCVVDAGFPLPSDLGRNPYSFKESSLAKLGESKAFARIAYDRIHSLFPGWRVSREVLGGPPATVILEKVHTWNPDLLIMGSHGRSFTGRVFLGSVSLKVAHEAPCSVRVVRAGRKSEERPIRIIVGCDDSTEAHAVIREVSRRSWPKNTEARIVSVVETLVPMVCALEASTYASEPAFTVIQDSDDRQRKLMQQTAEEFSACLQRAGLIVTTTVVDSDPKHELVDQAAKWNAGTIFVGARGLGRVEQILMGSVSTFVLTHAHCAVEIVRSAS